MGYGFSVAKAVSGHLKHEITKLKVVRHLNAIMSFSIPY